MKRLKRKLIYLLGGVLVSDFPPDVQQSFLCYLSKETLDKKMYNILNNKTK